MILVSKIPGIASECVTLALLHQAYRLFFLKRDWELDLLPSFLLTAVALSPVEQLARSIVTPRLLGLASGIPRNN